MTAAIIEIHNISVEPNGDVKCSCDFSAKADVFSRSLSRRIGYAHMANPAAETIDLLLFVTGITS